MRPREALKIKNPKGEVHIKKTQHWREEQDEQKRTNTRMARRGDRSQTSPGKGARAERPCPRLQGMGAGRRLQTILNPHDKEATQEERATQRKTPKASEGRRAAKGKLQGKKKGLGLG